MKQRHAEMVFELLDARGHHRFGDAQLARRMYDDDAPSVSLTGMLNAEAAKEILDTAVEALRIKENIPTGRIFDFTLAAEAAR